MVLDCAAAFPLNDDERALAHLLERGIDKMLRKAARGEQEPYLRARELQNPRISEYLSGRYALAGWIVTSHPNEAMLRFRPNWDYHKYLGDAVVAPMRASWKWEY